MLSYTVRKIYVNEKVSKSFKKFQKGSKSFKKFQKVSNFTLFYLTETNVPNKKVSNHLTVLR